MRYLLPIFLVALFITSCGDDDEKTFVDTLEGEYYILSAFVLDKPLLL